MEVHGAGDKDLIRGLLDGDERACETVRLWAQTVVRAGRLGRASEGHAEDIVQDVLLKVITNLRAGRFASRSALKTYVYEIAKHTCVDYLRAKYRQDRVPNDEFLNSIKLVSLGESPYQTIERIERHKMLAEAMRRSSDECRQLWVMIFEESRTYREISTALNSTEEAIKVRVHRCKQSLIRFIEQIRGIGEGQNIKPIKT